MYILFHHSDPPLYEEDIPEGSWLCRGCRMTASTSTVSTTELPIIISASETAAKELPSNTPTPTQTASGTESATAATVLLLSKKLKTQRSRSNSRMSNCSDSSNTEKKPIIVAAPAQAVPKHPIINTDPKRKPTPLDELIRAATIMNPRQFELPREMEIYDQFPGTDKSKQINVKR